MQNIYNLGMFDNTDDLEEFKSSTNCIVKLFMGPYEAHGIIRHRTQRLRGLRDCLTERGYNVELIPTVYLNRFTLEFYGREIFRCNIKSFQFNLPWEEDPICIRVMKVFREHEARFCKDKNVPTYVNVDYGMRFLEQLKGMTTSDLFLEPDVQLLYEIDDAKVLRTPVDSKHELTLEKSNSSISLALSYYDNDQLFPKFTSVTLPNMPAPAVGKALELDSLELKSLDNASNKTYVTIKSAQMDVFDDETRKPMTDIWTRTKENVNSRRARLMIQSEQIKSLEMVRRRSRHSETLHYLEQLRKKK